MVINKKIPASAIGFLATLPILICSLSTKMNPDSTVISSSVDYEPIRLAINSAPCISLSLLVSVVHHEHQLAEKQGILDLICSQFVVGRLTLNSQGVIVQEPHDRVPKSPLSCSRSVVVDQAGSSWSPEPKAQNHHQPQRNARSACQWAQLAAMYSGQIDASVAWQARWSSMACTAAVCRPALVVWFGSP